MKATDPAKKIWDAIPNEARMRILNNVWCGECRTSVNINVEQMSMVDRMLKIDGKCMTCHGVVCRMVEND